MAQAVTGTWARDLTLNDSSILKDLQMLRDRRLREWELLNDLSADAGCLCRQNFEDRYSRRMTECFRKLSEFLLFREKICG
jgi:hypothetical protein